MDEELALLHPYAGHLANINCTFYGCKFTGRYACHRSRWGGIGFLFLVKNMRPNYLVSYLSIYLFSCLLKYLFLCQALHNLKAKLEVLK